ncbi:MAG: tRNA (N6-isopentenyl adenosine(37)-C2)-methylthiotransferase MiaB, partial [Nitrospinota bacterium]
MLNDMEQAAKKYHLLTFGCQMNKYDSERIESVLLDGGFLSAADLQDADVIVLNTCSIREKAEQKVFSKLGRLAALKKKNRNLLIALGGCMATLRKENIFRRAPSVDILFGPDSFNALPRLIEDRRITGERQVDVSFDKGTQWDAPPPSVRPGKVTAWVGIMKGCDNRCTYCVVPDTRGPEVSRTPESILDEVEDIAGRGFKEINLLGQNVNSYGKGLGRGINFPKLLRMVGEVDGIKRIRFITSHPKDLSDELIEVMATVGKVCPSLHLPLQAGSDRILKMMNRKYTAKEYLNKIDKLNAAVPGIAISTDIMVGFPTETEKEFEETLNIMEKARFDSLYLFNFSPRPGTPAAGYEKPVSREVSQSRFERALKIHKGIVAEVYGREIGKTVEALCEGPYSEKTNGRGREMFGKTPENRIVTFFSDNAAAG